MELSFDILLFLVLVAFVAGFIDTLAGGGGLIALPALIVSGVPLLTALGTNKFQGTVGTATATLVMFRTRTVCFADVKLLMLAAFIGSAAGTIAVQCIDTRWLEGIIPIVLIGIAVYFILPSKHMSSAEGRREPTISDGLYAKCVVPLIGWYDGMFGPGTGSFFALAGVSLKGLGLVDATAVAKTLNFSTNFASLLVFLVMGKVVYLAGITMMIGQFAGAWTASHFLLKINPFHLRILVVIMCGAMLVKYMASIGWFW